MILWPLTCDFNQLDTIVRIDMHYFLNKEVEKENMIFGSENISNVTT